MSEFMRSLVRGGNWTARERKFGIWIRRILIVAMAVGILVWNVHMRRLAAESHVWLQWVNTQCQTGEAEMCLAYVRYAKRSGLPGEAFWLANPKLLTEARCIERKGWSLPFRPSHRLDYTQLAEKCR